jgi:hypothetical protein
MVPSDVSAREHERAERWLREGLGYTEARDLDFWTTYLRSWRVQLRLDRGAWQEAERESGELMDQAGMSPVSRVTVLCVLGLLRARRGEPGAAALLDEARTLAERTAELQRLGPVALARAEAAWLAGDPAGTAREARGAYELSLAKDGAWLRGTLAVWMHRAGALHAVPEGIPLACALELRGDALGAAAEWGPLGCPYERALALAGSGEREAVAEAVRVLEELGAVAAADAVRRRAEHQP